jgi:hypothetical protein
MMQHVLNHPKRWLAIIALVLPGLLLVAAGIERNAGRSNASSVMESNALTEPSAGEELADWVLSQGFARLRAGRFAEAQSAAVISEILWPGSPRVRMLCDAARAKAERLLGNFEAESDDANASGDEVRGRRAKALLLRFEDMNGRK